MFIAQADQLFLWSRKNWIKEIKKQGLAYSFLHNVILTLLFLLILAPFLLGYYKLLPGELAALFLITFLARMTSGLLKQLNRFNFTGIKHFLVSALAVILFLAAFVTITRFLLSGHLFGYLSMLLLSAACGYLTNKRVNLPADFFEELEQELNEKLKFTSLVFGVSGISMPKPSKRARPLLFKQSNHLFRKRTAANSLAELCLKSSLRNKTHVLYYIQLVAICAAIVIMVPNLKWLFWLGAALLLTGFTGLYWNTFIGADFVKMFKWREKEMFHASQNSMFLMALPGFAVISFGAGLQAFSWLGAFSALIAGTVITRTLSMFVALFMLTKGARRDDIFP